MLSAHFCLGLFTAIATFNWVDRGILPGSLSQIQRDLSLPPSIENMLSGILQSLYIFSYSIGSLYFGHAVHETRESLFFCPAFSQPSSPSPPPPRLACSQPTHPTALQILFA